MGDIIKFVKKIKVMTTTRLKNGGMDYVIVKQGGKSYQIPIDPVTQQFTHEFRGTWWHDYVLGIIDRRYRRRGKDDRTYFLQVLTARENSGMQGIYLGLKNFFMLPLIMSPWHIFDSKYWGMHEVGIFLGILAGFIWMDYARTRATENDEDNWNFTIKNYGLQSLIDTIQK